MNISFVVPCYNEQDALPETSGQLDRLIQDLIDRGKISNRSSVWLVDDGSSDATWSVIEGLADHSERFVGVKLSRNQGHQNALIAGLFSADGDAVISLDADLQDDLGAIERMVDAHAQGYEIVYGVRHSREKDTWFKRWTAMRYYALCRSLGVDLIPNHADYRLMGRRAIQALGAYGEVNLFLRGMIPQLGFPSTSVFYDRGERIAGESKYPLRKMLSLALNGITSFSAVPLRLIAAIGGIIFLVSMMMSIWVLGVRLFGSSAVPGWASTTLPIYVLGGVQLFCMGVIGEYVAKIYLETKRRPRFFIEQVRRGGKPVKVSNGATVMSQSPHARVISTDCPTSS